MMDQGVCKKTAAGLRPPHSIFDGTVAPTDSLNDVRIDLVHGYAYLTNIGNRGSLVVLNLKMENPGRFWSVTARPLPIPSST